MEHENMDNEDYLMHSGLLDDDDIAEWSERYYITHMIS